MKVKEVSKRKANTLAKKQTRIEKKIPTMGTEKSLAYMYFGK